MFNRSAGLTVLLKAARVSKSTVAGKRFHTFTVLLAKKFVSCLCMLVIAMCYRGAAVDTERG